MQRTTSEACVPQRGFCVPPRAPIPVCVRLTLQLRRHRFELRVVPLECFLHLFRDDFELDADVLILLLSCCRNEIELAECALVDDGGEGTRVMHHGMLSSQDQLAWTHRERAEYEYRALPGAPCVICVCLLTWSAADERDGGHSAAGGVSEAERREGVRVRSVVAVLLSVLLCTTVRVCVGALCVRVGRRCAACHFSIAHPAHRSERTHRRLHGDHHSRNTRVNTSNTAGQRCDDAATVTTHSLPAAVVVRLRSSSCPLCWWPWPPPPTSCWALALRRLPVMHPTTPQSVRTHAHSSAATDPPRQLSS